MVPTGAEDPSRLTADEMLLAASKCGYEKSYLSACIQELDRRETNRGRLSARAKSLRLQLRNALQAATSTSTSASHYTVSIAPATTPKPHNLPSLFEWQSEALRAWDRHGCVGIIEAVTGAGKTIVGLYAIARQLEEGEKAAVVVPSLVLLDQWTARLREAFPKARIGQLGNGKSDCADACDILVASVQSAAKWYIAASTKRPLIVADEVHRFGAPEYSKSLEEGFVRRLGLSATWQRGDGAHEDVLLPYFRRVVFSLDYTRAREENAISPFRVAMLAVHLESDERAAYDVAGLEMSRQRKKLISLFGAPSTENEGDFLKWVHRANKSNDPPGAAKVAGFFLTALTERKRVLSSARGKIAAVRNLGQAVKSSNRTIAFTMTIGSAEEIAAAWRAGGIACETYHSDLGKDDRDAIMRDFRAGRTKAIVTAKMFDEGVDVPDADLGIIIATSSSRVQLIQRFGRILRRKTDDRHARIALLYSRGTTEDPESGAHEEALEDINNAAEWIVLFDAQSRQLRKDGRDPLIEYLGPNWDEELT